MKTKIVIVILLFLLAAGAKAQINFSIAFDASKLNIINETAENGIVYNKIEYDTLDNTFEPGKPSLPVKYLKFVIPNNKDVDYIIVTSSSGVDYNLSFDVSPAQTAVIDGENISTPLFMLPDSPTYNENVWPSEKGNYIDYGFFDRVNKVVTIAIFPVQYFPTANKITFYTDMQLTVNLKNAIRSISPVKIHRSKSNNELYETTLKNLVQNPQDVLNYSDTTYYPIASNQNTARLTVNNVPVYEYVIITDASLVSSFSEFAEWKKQKGIDIGIVTTQEIYTNYTAGDIIGTNPINDPAGNIRQYLHDASLGDGTHEGTIYVLIGGDANPTNGVPVRTGHGDYVNINDGYPYYGDQNNIPTDWYYSDLTGGWNEDNDSYYGENLTSYNPGSADAVGIYPDIYVGRLLCNLPAQVQTWTDNVLAYEKNPGGPGGGVWNSPCCNWDYLTRTMMIQADWPQLGNEAQDVIANMTYIYPNNNFIADEFPPLVYVSPNYYPTYYNNGTIASYPPDPSLVGQAGHYTGTEVINTMNNHYGLIGLFCHGGPSAINTMTSGNGGGPAWGLYAMDNMDGIPGNGLDNLMNISSEENQAFPSIIYGAFSCKTNKIDATSGTTGQMNLGESFTANNVAPNVMGAAFLGNSGSGISGCSYQIFKLFADQVGHDILHGSEDVAECAMWLPITPECHYYDFSSHLGVAEALSKSNYSYGYNHFLRLSHILVGCPETPMWTNTPSTISLGNIGALDHDGNYYPGNIPVDLPVDITVSFQGVQSFVEVTVCLYKNNEVFEVQKVTPNPYYTNPSVTFNNVVCTTAGSLYCTITAHNYIPNQTVKTIYCPNHLTGTSNIEADLTLSGINVINKDTYIEPNVTLTVSGILKLNNSKLVVKQGGILVLESDALLTNGCSNDTWPGIEVWGNDDASQLTTGAQGTVILKNGATIENAEVAIKSFKTDASGTYVSGTGGGIIKATGAIFKNNIVGVQLSRYFNFKPTFPYQQLNDISSFKNCTFETTDDIYENGSEPEKFVSLDEVRGVMFLGNTFVNSASPSYAWNIRGKGIESVNASYTVKPLCTSIFYPCPAAQLQPATFTGLEYGLKATNTNPLYPVTITGTTAVKNEFDNNFRSIEIAGMSNAIITNNKIDVGENAGDYDPLDHSTDAYGIYLEGCTGYTIENNDLTTTHGGRFGIIIYNSGPKANMVFSNTFSFFERAACQAEGINASKNIGGITGTGLVFKCNTFTDNTSTDIAVTTGRIAKNQGYCFDTKTPAGNTFSLPAGILGNIVANPIGVMSFT